MNKQVHEEYLLKYSAAVIHKNETNIAWFI